MADPRAVVPYHDPHDQIISLDEQLPQYFQTLNPTLDDLTWPNISLPPTNYLQNAWLQPPHVHAEHSLAPAPFTPLFAPPEAGGRPLDPFEDRVLWSFVHGNNSAYNKDNNATTSVGSSNNTSNTPRINPAVGNAVAGPSGTPVGHHAAVEEGSGKRAMAILSETPPTYSCKYCQVLRDIVHTKGNHTAKLELHGKVGIISHGILKNNYFPEMLPGTWTNEKVNFEKKSLDQVKEFLQQYMQEKRQGRYKMSEDPLKAYYKAISVGIVQHPVNSEDFFDESSSDGNEVNQMDIQGPRKCSPRKKPSLAEQRERVTNLKGEDIMACFRMPIEKASETLLMCPTVIKNKCRKFGVARWPYRQVKSLDKKIMKLRWKMDSSHLEDRVCIQAQILMLQRDLNVLLQCPKS